MTDDATAGGMPADETGAAEAPETAAGGEALAAAGGEAPETTGDEARGAQTGWAPDDTPEPAGPDRTAETADPDRSTAPARAAGRERGRGRRDRVPSKRARGPAFRSPDGGAAASIRTRGLTKAYGHLVAVDHLNLEVHPGEIYGLLGQNGAGKTTTILMLLGLAEPSHGEVRVVGLDPAREPLAVKRRVGYLPDAVGFYGNLTGRQNLRYTARLNGIPTDEAERRMAEVLELVGLTDRADDRTETYSRGMLQRLGIADALLKDPDVLILDEPTTAIDPLGVVEILELLRSLAHQRRIAILLSSHLLNQVQSTCDRIGIFATGRLIGNGTIEELAGQFGFPLDDLELALDVPREEAAAVTEALRAVPGVLEVTAEHGIRDERAWMLRTDAGRDVGSLTRAVLDAVGDRPITRIGRRRVELEAIYRRAVELQAGLDRAAGTDRRPAA